MVGKGSQQQQRRGGDGTSDRRNHFHFPWPRIIKGKIDLLRLLRGRDGCHALRKEAEGWEFTPKRGWKIPA